MIFFFDDDQDPNVLATGIVLLWLTPPLCEVRPDMTAADALAVVEMVRRKGPTADELPRYRRFRADGA